MSQVFVKFCSMLPCVFVFVLCSGFVGLCCQSVSLRSVFELCRFMLSARKSSFCVRALSAYAVSPLVIILC